MLRVSTLLLLCLISFATVVSAFGVQAPTAILIDARTARVIYAKNPDTRREPASTTKTLTALVAVENVPDLNTLVTVSAKAAATEGSSAQLEAGMKIPLRELLYALLMMSGNDAATAIAEHVAGSEAAFAKLMNTRAKAAGATHSNFVNPSGLPNSLQYTTVRDLALIGRAAIRNTAIAQICATREHHFAWIKAPVQNHNRLLWTVKGADGIKNGYTNSARQTWVGSATRDGLQLITAIMGAETRNMVIDDQVAMFDYGFSLYKQKAAINKGDVVGQLRVKGGKMPSVDVVAGQATKIWTRRDETQPVEQQIELPEELKAPVAEGQQLGTLRYVSGSEVLAEVPLIPASAVDTLPALVVVGRYVKWGSVGAVGTFGLAFLIRIWNYTRRRFRSLSKRRRQRQAWRVERRKSRNRRMQDYGAHRY